MASALPSASGKLDFVRCFARTTEDPDWVRKVLVGGFFVLLSSLLVGLPFVLGYYGRVVRAAAAGEPRALPEWDDLGGLFGEGLRLAGVYLGYTLGVLLFAFGLGFVAMLPSLLAAGLGREAGGLLPALSSLGLLLVYALTMLLSLALAVYLPAALARTAARGRMADGFDWRANVDFIRANLGNYLLALVVYLVAAFVAQLGILLCCVGLFPTVFWSHVTGAVAIGEAARLGPAPL
jgi:hypothetical protein